MRAERQQDAEQPADENVFVEGADEPRGNAQDANNASNATNEVILHEIKAGSEVHIFAGDEPAWVYGQPSVRSARQATAARALCLSYRAGGGYPVPANGYAIACRGQRQWEPLAPPAPPGRPGPARPDGARRTAGCGARGAPGSAQWRRGGAGRRVRAELPATDARAMSQARQARAALH